MLSVIIDTGDSAERLGVLLAALTQGAIDGLVREVTIVGGPAELLAALREETGAEIAADLAGAIAAARSDRLLVIPGRLRLRSDWLEMLGRHLRDGEGDAVLAGEGGWLTRRAEGLLIAKAAAQGVTGPDLPRLRRALARGAVRLA